MKTVGIIDYSAGNIFNITKAIEYLKVNTVLCNKYSDMSFDYLILPGVGAFSSGISSLKSQGLDQLIFKHVQKERPFLGICLGMQLLFSSSEEGANNEGLNLVSGKVTKLPINTELKIPNIGWFALEKPNNITGDYWDNSFFKDVDPKSEYYFVHSYFVQPNDAKVRLAETYYGGLRFCSAVKKNNIYGFQFHPEKSGNAGIKLLDNFIKLT